MYCNSRRSYVSNRWPYAFEIFNTVPAHLSTFLSPLHLSLDSQISVDFSNFPPFIKAPSLQGEMTVFPLFRFSVFLFVLKTYETKQTHGKGGKKNVVLCQPNHHQAGKWGSYILNILNCYFQNNTSVHGECNKTSLIFSTFFVVVFCQPITFFPLFQQPLYSMGTREVAKVTLGGKQWVTWTAKPFWYLPTDRGSH